MTRKNPSPGAAEPTVKVATYLRLSTDEDHQPFSLDAQRERLGAFITSQQGWSHVCTYSDQFSGAYAERPGLEEAPPGRSSRFLRRAPRVPRRPIRPFAQGPFRPPRRPRRRRGG